MRHLADIDGEAPDGELSSSDGVESAAEQSDVGQKRRLSDAIEFITKCLLDLSPSIEQATRTCAILVYTWRKRMGRCSFTSPRLQDQMSCRFPDTSLVERLGEASWQRFVRVRQSMAPVAQEDEVKDFQFGAQSTYSP